MQEFFRARYFQSPEIKGIFVNAVTEDTLEV